MLACYGLGSSVTETIQNLDKCDAYRLLRFRKLLATGQTVSETAIICRKYLFPVILVSLIKWLLMPVLFMGCRLNL